MLHHRPKSRQLEILKELVDSLPLSESRQSINRLSPAVLPELQAEYLEWTDYMV
jgi:hypothetical protein